MLMLGRMGVLKSGFQYTATVWQLYRFLTTRFSEKRERIISAWINRILDEDSAIFKLFSRLPMRPRQDGCTINSFRWDLVCLYWLLQYRFGRESWRIPTLDGKDIEIWLIIVILTKEIVWYTFLLFIYNTIIYWWLGFHYIVSTVELESELSFDKSAIWTILSGVTKTNGSLSEEVFGQ